MVMPVGPVRLQCKKCGRTHWEPWYSDAIYIVPFPKCGGTELDHVHHSPRVPRALWPMVRTILVLTNFHHKDAQ